MGVETQAIGVGAGHARPLHGQIAELVERALAEDVGAGDVTTEALFGPEARARAELLLKEPGVVSGLAVAERVFRTLDPSVESERVATDGDRVDETPARLLRLEGSTRALLSGERTALNFLGRLSGIATATRAYADAVRGTGAVILDTRKTTPGLRALEKEAVAHGGGVNHRLGLFDAVLVKDNHLRLVGGVVEAVARLRAALPGFPLEVEAETLAEVECALELGVERILLDNMPPALMREAVALVSGRAELEASGGVSLATVRAIAETGVDTISVGALTHSARALDVSLEVLP